MNIQGRIGNFVEVDWCSYLEDRCPKMRTGRTATTWRGRTGESMAAGHVAVAAAAATADWSFGRSERERKRTCGGAWVAVRRRAASGGAASVQGRGEGSAARIGGRGPGGRARQRMVLGFANSQNLTLACALWRLKACPRINRVRSISSGSREIK